MWSIGVGLPYQSIFIYLCSFGIYLFPRFLCLSVYFGTPFTCAFVLTLVAQFLERCAKETRLNM